jgi:hypothetical protein
MRLTRRKSARSHASAPSFADESIEPLKRRVEFRFERRIGSGEAIHDALRPGEVFVLPLKVPVRRRGEKDGTQVRDLVRQFDRLRTKTDFFGAFSI